ncbi:hypothetical protein RFI_21765 [Reticulomyxa filosa]|uniref:VTT domain-containing protein n=1 Tax=Reticulomyxa filosa TaxID=46433 RepID=X6MNL9_RETFI|nr:hypothetical protein RFI_21765 [Reticulomyxa filosa]|eukprot:ETO15598.1 hypothetical protein RFI_21765 [Reticulomyxa filosa]
MLPETQDNEQLLSQSTKKEKGRWFENLTWKSYLKLALFLALVVIGIVAAVKNGQVINEAKDFLDWMKHHIFLGTFIFIVIYFCATVLFVPGNIIGLKAPTFIFFFFFMFCFCLNGMNNGTKLCRIGANYWRSIYILPSNESGTNNNEVLKVHFVTRNTDMFQMHLQIIGVVIATVAVFIGASTGATAAFLLGRFLFRESVSVLVQKYEKFEIIDKVVLLIHVGCFDCLKNSNFVISLNTDAMGLTSVKFRDYCIAHIGMLPGTIAYCFLGSTLSSVSDAASTNSSKNTTVLIVLIVGSIIAFVGMLYVAFIAKKQFTQLAKEVEDEKNNNQNQTGSNSSVNINNMLLSILALAYKITTKLLNSHCPKTKNIYFNPPLCFLLTEKTYDNVAFPLVT